MKFVLIYALNFETIFSGYESWVGHF